MLKYSLLIFCTEDVIPLSIDSELLIVPVPLDVASIKKATAKLRSQQITADRILISAAVDEIITQPSKDDLSLVSSSIATFTTFHFA